MAETRNLLGLLGLLLLLPHMIHGKRHEDGDHLVVTYWGQFDEGSLADACDTGDYGIVILSFLSTFGRGNEPKLDLSGHCDAGSGECKGLDSQIEHCQNNGVKILLSLGGADGNYGLDSKDDANNVAQYLWNTYLGGQDGSGPLGQSNLDGIDLDIERGSPKHYNTLVQSLHDLMQDGDKKFYLGAAPQCPFPDEWAGPGGDSALQTGLFDYVWVQFYNNDQCQYHRNGNHLDDLFSSWDQWTSSVPNAKILMGLPASPDAATDNYDLDSGWLPSDVMVSDVLPHIRGYNNFGGVMLWSYYYDKNPSYSAAIKNAM
ncbi:hypothetical protein Mapa_006829 [Marchantia paleacea]|nr:hypothetical protein Mapa_006829 [Marchantia paleacea]